MLLAFRTSLHNGRKRIVAFVEVAHVTAHRPVARAYPQLSLLALPIDYSDQMRRCLSLTSAALFDQAGVRADEIDAAIEDLVGTKAAAILRFNHPHVKRVRHATNINLVQVSRRSRNLLIEIEQHSGVGPSWQYREHTPRLRCKVNSWRSW